MRVHNAPTLFDRFFADFEPALAASTAARGYRPALDIHEHEDRYELVADLPGVTAEDVEVEFKEGVLHVQGARNAPELPEGIRVHRRERPYGRFHHRIALGDEIDVEGIEARFEDGVLTVRVPRSERSLPRQIPVTAH